MAKLCIIGAGSTKFTKHITTDFLLMPEFKDLELSLHDLDPERLRASEEVVQSIVNQLGLNDVRITTHDDRRTALPDADFVLTTIQVGGYTPATVIDFELPKKYGLRQTIADTLGIGGIMRGLRTIPVLLDIGRDIAKLCPNAIWLQYVNPMCMNMLAIGEELPELNAVGLCHSVQNTAEMLAADLGEDMANIRFECSGINHMAFYSRFEKHVDGKVEDLYPRLRALAPDIIAGRHNSVRSHKPMEHGRTLSERVRYEMLLRLGYFVTESSEHFSEYVPWFIKRDQPELLEQFDVPLDDYIDRCEAAIKQWAALSDTIRAKTIIETSSSNEYASKIARATVTNQPVTIYGNVLNRDLLIPNLPPDSCVEVPITVNSEGLVPQSVVAMPPQLAALIQTNINVQKLTVAAVREGRRDHVYHAAMLDPHTAAELSLAQIWALVDELIDAHGDYISANLRVKTAVTY